MAKTLPPIAGQRKRTNGQSVRAKKKDFGPVCFVVVMVVFPSGYKILVKKIVSFS